MHYNIVKWSLDCLGGEQLGQMHFLHFKLPFRLLGLVLANIRIDLQ